MFILPVVFFVPLLASLWLWSKRDDVDDKQAIAISIKASAISSLVALIISGIYLLKYSAGVVVNISVWRTMQLAFSFDGLSLVMINVISLLGFLTHYFLSWYLPLEKQLDTIKKVRLVASSNLLIASSLLLVVADNLLLLYVSWQLIALACTVFIKDSAPNKQLTSLVQQNNHNKSTLDHIRVRFADIAFLLGIILAYHTFDTVNFYKINQIIELLSVDSKSILWANILLIIAIVIKSAQLPVHTWFMNRQNLSVPIISLIQSIVCVLVSVYVIVRLHSLFLLTPNILFYWLASIGAVSIIVASLCALAQRNLVKILMYISIGQIGYMFVALAIGAWQVAVFHAMAYTCIGSLLYLASAVLLKSVNDETDISKLGGLKDYNQPVFTSMVIGLGALVALPLISFGLYATQSAILIQYVHNNTALFSIVILGMFLTTLLALKLIQRLFYGKPTTQLSELTASATSNQASASQSEDKTSTQAVEQLTEVSLAATKSSEHTTNLESTPQIIELESNPAYNLPLMLLVFVCCFALVWVTPPINEILPKATLQADSINIIKAGLMACMSLFVGLITAWYLYIINDNQLVNKLKVTKFGASFYRACRHDLGFVSLYQSKPSNKK